MGTGPSVHSFGSMYLSLVIHGIIQTSLASALAARSVDLEIKSQITSKRIYRTHLNHYFSDSDKVFIKIFCRVANIS